ncbi:hypothetical protein KP509_14G091300 [Ceratopteris richardii]|uniref:S-acyltransferase n=2 Tax=Ceratopteris richardii TaxID=49495 RepID=A0A8T2TA87_CERRI|nr:hypothetical protein KP509_14G091300 [Ceratopteris richardii]KAH7416430.1 hypothetical protein KP509_14G091300 [Ceratopteris richardii]KAH7416431.1 hypothetical protein KP509_14G091300 [Ceratopteris richardii]
MAISSNLRSFRYLWASFALRVQIFIDKAVQLAGPLYIILAVTLISCIIYLFFTTILPSIHSLTSLQGISHAIISIWLIFNVFFNYMYCIRTDPGSPSDSIDLEHNPMSLSDRQGPSGEGVRWCKTCLKVKPPMTHHCHICRRCILKMDHHCPWMHNCIGFFNYRFFFLFLFYLWIGCAYTTYMASIPLRKQEEDDEDVQVLFTFVLAIAVFTVLTGLFSFHVYLVLSAQTTIDFYGHRRRRRQARLEARQRGEKFVPPMHMNAYDMGKLQNLRTLFDHGGSYWWLVMFLPHNRPPKGDGIHFTQRHADDYGRTIQRLPLVLDEDFNTTNKGSKNDTFRHVR